MSSQIRIPSERCLKTDMSSGYKIIELTDLLEAQGEDWVKDHLSHFSCPLNDDIEIFLRSKSITFSQQALARTSLVYTSYKDNPVLVGYFTISNKIFLIRKDNVTRKTWDRLKKFGAYIPETRSLSISAPLIAQLGKNFTNGYNTLISGSELLSFALDRVHLAQSIVGGKVVYLECEDKPSLIQFYNNHGFAEFDRRPLDKDETDVINGTYMIQMLRYG